jgi:hypothetical protein
MTTDEQRDHEQTLAKIQARKEAFALSPFWFTVWDTAMKVLHIAFWLCFWGLVVQCNCKCLL